MVPIALLYYTINVSVNSNLNSSSQEDSQITNETNQDFMQKRLSKLQEMCNIYKNPFRDESSSLHYHSNFSRISSFQYFWFKNKYALEHQIGYGIDRLVGQSINGQYLKRLG